MISSENSQLYEISSLEAEAAEWLECQKLSQQYGLPACSLRDLEIDPALRQRIPLEVLQTYRMLPIAENDGQITLAMADPLDVVAEDVVRYMTGRRVLRVVSPPSQIDEILSGKGPAQETLLDSILKRIPESGEITYVQSAEASAQQQEQESAELEPTAPIIQLVSSIIGDAIRMQASDIHVEPLKHVMRVRYRLDGYLRTIVELPQRVQSACITRLKIISGLDISESRKPQDGRTRAILEGREVDMRVSTLPTYFGEKVVLRILDPKAVMVDLNNLGLQPRNLESVKQVLSSSQGMILCTGPTGSGKTSTLYSALRHLNQESDNVVTVEDPIEYQLEGINQVQVNPRAGVTFATALRSILRQDPDVVLIGEIRDLETAEIAVQSAQTGHLVLSTLHTNDALSSISRLVLMGIAPYMLASSLLCVIAQRLVRRLCPHCRQSGPVPESVLSLLKAAGVPRVPSASFFAQGCPDCHQVGYRGRMGIFEVILVSDPLREMLLRGASEAECERLVRSQEMGSLLDDGWTKCEQGLTSWEELLRVVTIRRSGGRRCPGCEASVPVEYPLCVYCGQSLLSQCLHCGEALQPDWRFCPHCRHAVEEAVLVEAPVARAALDNFQGERWVLLVTQDCHLRALVSSWLLRHDYCLLTAEHPEHALTLTRCHLPDLILLDLDTFELNAERWIATLRRQLDTSFAAVIGLSRMGDEGVLSLGCGADSYLLKPLEESLLLRRIQETLRVVPPRTTMAESPHRDSRRLPRQFSDPLRRVLAAGQHGRWEVAAAEMAALAGLAVQYTYALCVATLLALGRLPAAPLWAKAPGCREAFLEKVEALPEWVTELEQLGSFSELLGLARGGARLLPHLAQLLSVPTGVGAERWVAESLARLRPWLGRLQAFCALSLHQLDGPDENGAIQGRVHYAGLELVLEGALTLYSPIPVSC